MARQEFGIWFLLDDADAFLVGLLHSRFRTRSAHVGSCVISAKLISWKHLSRVNNLTENHSKESPVLA